MRRAWGTAVLVTAMMVLAGCDWTQSGFSGANTFYNPVEPALTASTVSHLGVDWSVPCACAEPLVAGGVVYVLDGYGPTDDGTSPLSLRAFNAATGQVKWSTPLGKTAPSKRLAAAANGLVYISISAPTPGLIAVDAQTGSVRWQITPPAPGSGAVQVSTVPVVDGPLVFVEAFSADGTSEVSAIDVQGHVVWSAVPGGSVQGLTVGDHTVYVATRLRLTVPPYGINLVIGYAASDGAVKSAVAPPFDNLTPVDSLGFGQGLLYGTLLSGHMTDGGVTFAVHPDTGAIAWSTMRSSGRDFVAEQGITPDVVITRHITEGGTTTANDARTGAPRWQSPYRTVASAGDLVYLVNNDAVHIVRATDGTEVATMRLNPSGPPTEFIASITPSAGRLYIATLAHLYAFAPT